MKNLTINHNTEFSTNLFDNGQPKDSMSDKYQPVSTSSIITGLEGEGFKITGTSQVRSNKEENRPFAKHLVRMTHQDLYNTRTDDRPEIIITNSLNGSSSFKVMLGMFRFVCANGIIMGDAFFQESVRHTGNDFYTNVIQAVLNGAEKFNQIDHVIAELKNKELTRNQMQEFIDLVETDVISPRLTNRATKSLNILCEFRPRRNADRTPNAWTMLNLMQEYLIRGGIQYSKIQEVKHTDRDGKITFDLDKINGTTREIKSVDGKIKTNQAIMDIALDHFNIAA